MKERTANNVNYFQMKREIEKNVEVVENDLSKGQKEMKSLQLMVHTYRNNPKFGDVTKFEMELESVTLRVQHSQSQVRQCLISSSPVSLNISSNILDIDVNICLDVLSTKQAEGGQRDP